MHAVKAPSLCTYVRALLAITMAVNPVQLALEVGSRVRLECAGFGNFIESITWERDIGKDEVDLLPACTVCDTSCFYGRRALLFPKHTTPNMSEA